GTLAGGIAHDLNNVLTPILMSLSLLRMKLSQPRDLELLSTLEASANRGADMVKQIIGFARGVEGRTLTIYPKDVVKEIEHLIIDTFPKCIEFDIRCGPDVANVEGDPTQLHQVLLNLCLNARDAMPEGGKLDIQVSNEVVTDLSAIANPDARSGRYVVFEVRDTGAGIPADLKERIFDPFFTTKEVGKGTGLGLSTTLGIVRSHRGFADVSSQTGKGTSFRIYIPAAAAAPLPTPPPPATPALQFGKGELVMVVDDEVSILTATTQTLEAFGYRVLTACHGADAVSKFKASMEKPGIVITDLMMPVMDGPSLIKALLAIQPDLPFIAASGLNNHLSTQALSLGVKHFLLKPYNFPELLRLLHEQLRASAK
ncbi:MAG: sensory box protein, partial [Verrucomicrobiaceae bacterium]|nr:sensory box protein [Verrucomicrobiaceae bacterium]